jgi:hypothetical protein
LPFSKPALDPGANLVHTASISGFEEIQPMRWLRQSTARRIAAAVLGVALTGPLLATPADAFFFCFSFGGGGRPSGWRANRPPPGWFGAPFAQGPYSPRPFVGYPSPGYPPSPYPWGGGTYGWPGAGGSALLLNHTPYPGIPGGYAYQGAR